MSINLIRGGAIGHFSIANRTQVALEALPEARATD
jgi:hypothetical protein